MANIIEVKDLHKSFKLPHERYSSLKQSLFNLHRRSYEKLDVLKGVDLEIKEGEFFGIVGKNGSGKSTLLKILSKIYQPTSGSVDVRGRLTPFIELGVGFSPELSGRDNVFLNGALLGLTRKELEGKYDEIVAFAELEKFMDQKLKNYSSGMQLRLAFSIAIQAKTEILLLDEVLAVGDESFQQKCLGVFAEYKRQKRTIILVTHDMGAVRKFCDRAALLHDGVIADIGNPHPITYQYMVMSDEKARQIKELENQAKEPTKVIKNIKLTDEKSKPKEVFRNGDWVQCAVEWKASENPRNAGVALYRETGEYIFGTNTALDKVKLTGNKFTYKFKLNVNEGKYFLKIGLFGDSDREIIEFVDVGPRFRVEIADRTHWEGMTELDHEWKP